jgi:hypothetical protein
MPVRLYLYLHKPTLVTHTGTLLLVITRPLGALAIPQHLTVTSLTTAVLHLFDTTSSTMLTHDHIITLRNFVSFQCNVLTRCVRVFESPTN